MPGLHDSIACRDEHERVLTTCQRDSYTGDKPSNDAGIAAGTDTSADSGPNAGTGDTSNMAGQNDQPGNSTTVPAGRPGIPRINAPADAPAASSGK